MPILRTLLVLILLSGPALYAQGATSRNLSAAEAFSLQQRQEDVYLLDVRTLQEYMQVRIKGAHLISIDQVQRRLGELPRNRPILVYCAVGSRSSQVAGYLARLGFPEVYNMYGGIWAWQLRGYPVLTGRP